jgi:peptidyl-tRNA hydrolase
MANIRHTVIVRKDLMLSPGLLAAQVAHISDNFIRYQFLSCKEGDTLRPIFSNSQLAWLQEPYLSVLAVNCDEDLQVVMKHAHSEGLQIFEWFDTIPSPTFPDRAIKVRVGISIGPDDFDKIKIVTGSLPLY